MRKPLAFFAAAALAAAPVPSAAQTGLGVGVRIGTLGIGGDVAVGLSEKVQLRGGVALMPFTPSGTFSDIDWEVDLPSSFITAGVDFFPTGGSFRLSGGVLLKPDDPEIQGEFSGTVDIGGREYSGAEVGALTGVVESGEVAPFAMIGWGRHTSTGVKLYLDLGAAFLSEPELTLEASGQVASDPQFQQDLETERRDVEDDLDTWLRVYPLLNVGVRIGLGG